MSISHPLLLALFAQPDNAGVLRHLNLHRVEDVRSFCVGDGHPLDEGGQIFFHKYGGLVPATTHCQLELTNLLVHERTARVFALHTGRFTIAILPDPECELPDLCAPLYGETLDVLVDLTNLGADWVLFAADGESEAEKAFFAAYQFAGR